ncbi:hypothetical protein DFH28DRAFT_912841, partial [Melampsora americana]
QQHTKKTLREKQAVLKTKYNLFERNVKKFNTDFPNDPILCPTFDEMKTLSLADGFWDIGQLTHPDQPWAVDQDTREGIRAYLDMTHASDELRRIARECRQSINWALEMEGKTNRWIVDVVRSKILLPADRLNKSRKILQSLHSRIEQEHARLIIFWNCGMLDLLSKTKTYCQLTEQEEEGLRIRWSELVIKSRHTWSTGAQAEIVNAVPLDEDEEAELVLDLGDDDDDNRNPIEDDDESLIEGEGEFVEAIDLEINEDGGVDIEEDEVEAGAQ